MNLNTNKYLESLRKQDNPPVDNEHIDKGEIGNYVMSWRCVLLHELTPEENQGSHNVYIDLLTRDGRRINSSFVAPKIAYGWSGMAVHEVPVPLTLEKPEGEAGYNFPMFGEAQYYLSVKQGAIPSDTVHGLEGGKAHRSYYVVFQYQEIPFIPEVVEVGCITIPRKKVRSVIESLQQIGGMARREIAELEGWLA